jgi:hypothetical protein
MSMNTVKGAPLTTYLTPEGEKQLEDVASVGGGELVRAGQGDTGIDKMADSLRKLMSEELTERVETVYADVFQYPLALATLFLLAEAGAQLGRRRRPVQDEPLPKTPHRKLRRTLNAALLALLALGCEPYDRLFERDSPTVEEAKAALKSGDSKKAIELLTQFLESGECQEGVIGFGARAKAYPHAAFDLGLAFGTGGKLAPSPQKNAQATPPAPSIPGLGLPVSPADPGAQSGPGGPGTPPGKTGELDCALRLLAPLADGESEPAALRARALYLMGQIEMQKGEFEGAADAYTRGLRFAPALPEGSGDSLGRDLAFNRSIALLRALEKKKQEEEQKKKDEQEKKEGDDSDKKDESKPDEQKSDSQDQEKKDDPQKPKDSASDDKQKAPKEPENGKPEATPPQDGAQQPKPEAPNDQAPEPRQAPQVSQDERILDQLEETPTLQEETAKQRARGARGRVLEDK